MHSQTALAAIAVRDPAKPGFRKTDFNQINNLEAGIRQVGGGVCRLPLIWYLARANTVPTCVAKEQSAAPAMHRAALTPRAMCKHPGLPVVRRSVHPSQCGRCNARSPKVANFRALGCSGADSTGSSQPNGNASTTRWEASMACIRCSSALGLMTGRERLVEEQPHGHQAQSDSALLDWPGCRNIGLGHSPGPKHRPRPDCNWTGAVPNAAPPPMRFGLHRTLDLA